MKAKKALKSKNPEYFDDWLEKQMKNPEFEREFMAEELRASIASQVQAARKKRHISQKGLAKLLRMSQGEVSRIENGEQNITVDTLGKIAAGLKAKTDISIAVIK
jgi:ribosome-binding protein aMBF1 (putative translation factor)